MKKGLPTYKEVWEGASRPPPPKFGEELRKQLDRMGMKPPTPPPPDPNSVLSYLQRRGIDWSKE